MAHPNHEEWMKYLYGELAPPKQKTLAGHLQDCVECREQVDAWQTAIVVLDRGKQANGGRSNSVRYFFRGAVRWAAVVFLILGLGFVMGRFTAAAPDMARPCPGRRKCDYQDRHFGLRLAAARA